MGRRDHINKITNVGEVIADQVALFVGSWTFVLGQAGLMVVWVILNTLTMFHIVRFDVYPFVFLNLFMSAEAAFSTPIILMSQNRAAARDHKRDDTEASEVDELFQINQVQLTILKQQSEILELLHTKLMQEPPLVQGNET